MPNAKPVKMTLFHANWCGHCTDFMPTWNAMKSNRSAKKNIEFVDYEESQMKGLPKEDRQIEGFPTIKISIHEKTYNYMGKRNQDDIFGFVATKIRNMVTGNVTSSSASNRSITASSEPSIHSEPMQGGGNMQFSATSEDPSYKSYRMRGGNYDTIDDDIRGPIPEKVQAHFDNASRLPAGALEQESASMPELLDLLVGGNNPPNPLNDIPLLRVSEH